MFFCIFRGDLRNCEVQPYACGCKGNGSLIYVFSIKPALNIYNILIKQIRYEYNRNEATNYKNMSVLQK